LDNPEHVLGEVEFPEGVVDEATGDVVGAAFTLRRVLSPAETIALLRDTPSCPGVAEVERVSCDRTLFRLFRQPKFSKARGKDVRRLKKYERKVKAYDRLKAKGGVVGEAPSPPLRTGFTLWEAANPLELTYSFEGHVPSAFDDSPACVWVKSQCTVVKRWPDTGSGVRQETAEEKFWYSGMKWYDLTTVTVKGQKTSEIRREYFRDKPVVTTTHFYEDGQDSTTSVTDVDGHKSFEVSRDRAKGTVTVQVLAPGHEAVLRMDAQKRPHGLSEVTGSLGLFDMVTLLRMFPHFCGDLRSLNADHDTIVASTFPHMAPGKIQRRRDGTEVRTWASPDGSCITETDTRMSDGSLKVTTECWTKERRHRDVGTMPGLVVRLNGELVYYSRLMDDVRHSGPNQPTRWAKDGLTEYFDMGRRHRKGGPAVICNRTHRVKHYLNDVRVVRSGAELLPFADEEWDVVPLGAPEW
jgi:hypothetical protein